LPVFAERRARAGVRGRWPSPPGAFSAAGRFTPLDIPGHSEDSLEGKEGKVFRTMHRPNRIAVAVVVALAVVAVAASAASAAIRIARINYNSPGRDTRSNASLNAEWIRLENTGGSARLRGWSISDAVGHVYRFQRFTLRAGRTVTIHTGDGTDTAANLYWGSGNYIWNNDEDTARLRRPNDALADTCRYDNSSASSVTC
jgi:Lamin Tail Domain